MINGLISAGLAGLIVFGYSYGAHEQLSTHCLASKAVRVGAC